MSAGGGDTPGADAPDRRDEAAEGHALLEVVARLRVRLELGLLRVRSERELRAVIARSVDDADEISRLAHAWLARARGDAAPLVDEGDSSNESVNDAESSLNL